MSAQMHMHIYNLIAQSGGLITFADLQKQTKLSPNRIMMQLMKLHKEGKLQRSTNG
jgi:Fic family protein